MKRTGGTRGSGPGKEEGLSTSPSTERRSREGDSNEEVEKRYEGQELFVWGGALHDKIPRYDADAFQHDSRGIAIQRTLKIHITRLEHLPSSAFTSFPWVQHLFCKHHSVVMLDLRLVKKQFDWCSDEIYTSMNLVSAVSWEAVIEQ